VDLRKRRQSESGDDKLFAPLERVPQRFGTAVFEPALPTTITASPPDGRFGDRT
jgi:hypothetical protein